MFYAVLLLYTVSLYLPPFDLAVRLTNWTEHQHWAILPHAVTFGGNVMFIVIMVGGYLVLAGICSVAVRRLWPLRKPWILDQLCAPDRVELLNLGLLIAGGVLLIFTLACLGATATGTARLHVNPAVPVLAMIVLLGMLGHFWEMDLWDVDEREARRLIWVRTM